MKKIDYFPHLGDIRAYFGVEAVLFLCPGSIKEKIYAEGQKKRNVPLHVKE